VLQWTLWLVLMLVVMAWLGRSRLRQRPASEARRLVHPLSTLIVGLVCFILFAGLVVVSNVFPNDTASLWTTLVFAGFALLAMPLILGFFLEEHQASDEGLNSRNFLGIKKHLSWSDLRTVHYSQPMKWFRLETQSGTIVRVSVMLMGLPEFARLLLERTPRTAIDAGTLEVLRATADGKPPSVWA